MSSRFLSRDNILTQPPANGVPLYTREHLQQLSTMVNTRLKMLDEDAAFYPAMLAKTRRVHVYLTATLIVLGSLWLATSTVILVAVFRGNVVERKV
ncbi:hypothetical protein F4777DRAFT_546827 [Nemania sp. FL0916]|nr:hypothetical protein F4777DRAFT_546827 [Nemania sp. FL0916]